MKIFGDHFQSHIFEAYYVMSHANVKKNSVFRMSAILAPYLLDPW